MTWVLHRLESNLKSISLLLSKNLWRIERKRRWGFKKFHGRKREGGVLREMGFEPVLIEHSCISLSINWQLIGSPTRFGWIYLCEFTKESSRNKQQFSSLSLLVLSFIFSLHGPHSTSVAHPLIERGWSQRRCYYKNDVWEDKKIYIKEGIQVKRHLRGQLGLFPLFVLLIRVFSLKSGSQDVRLHNFGGCDKCLKSCANSRIHHFQLKRALLFSKEFILRATILSQF